METKIQRKLLAIAGLRASKLLDKQVGVNWQVRQQLYCPTTGKFIAFFCRNSKPAKTEGYPTRPACLEHTMYVPKNKIPIIQKIVGYVWLWMIKWRYRKRLGHPSN
jgi:hypothetical protein